MIRGIEKHTFLLRFYCAEQKLVIKVDGKYHDNRQEYDRNRDIVINQLGLRVLRIRNEELQNIESVKRKIVSHLD